MRFQPLACAAIMAMICLAPLAVAEISVSDARRLGVDVVWLKGGGELRGAILDTADGQPKLMAVRRGWLAKVNPRRLEQEEQQEQDRAREIDEQLLARIEEWMARRPDDRQLLAALEPERNRIADRIAGKSKPAEPPEFLLIDLDPESVRRFVAQPPQRRQLALVGWEWKLAEVESAAAMRLMNTVKEKVKDWQEESPDLSERLPPLRQSEEEWAARVALWEYVFRQPCDFQGTEAFVVRSDGSAPRPNVAELIAPTLESALSSQLGDLLNPGGGKPAAVDRWRTISTATAEKAGLSACRVTRVNIDAAGASGGVASDFLVHFPDGRWESIWSDDTPADVSSVREEELESLRNDPQVKSVAAALQALGGGQFDQALRFGAAVRSAQAQSDSRFFAFRDRYVRRLEGPPLRWPSTGGAKGSP